MKAMLRGRLIGATLAGLFLAASGPACSPGKPNAVQTESAESSPEIHRVNKLPFDDPHPKPEPETGAPVAVLDEPQHQFGVMDPNQVGRHDFVIRNEGDAPLKLMPLTTTCTCTMAEIDNPLVLPGGVARVHMEWKTGAKQLPLFLQGGDIATNDPNHELIELRVRGSVRLQLGADPPQLIFPAVSPTARAEHETLVYSRVWDDFRISAVTSSLEGIEWTLSPADAAELENTEARSGYRLCVTLPDDLPQGDFRGWVRFDVNPAAGEKEHAPAHTYELPIEGRVLRRLAVYGAAINSLGVVNLGTSTAGEGTHELLRLKVRDELPELKVKRITTEPEFVQVRIEPNPRAADRYEMHVAIPRDAPACVHLASRQGSLKIEFDHPRIAELNLKLDFAVLRSELSAAR